MEQEEALVTANEVIRATGIPRSTLYHLVQQGVITPHPTRFKPWHQRDRIGFRMSEVRAALGLPPEPRPAPPAGER